MAEGGGAWRRGTMGDSSAPQGCVATESSAWQSSAALDGRRAWPGSLWRMKPSGVVQPRRAGISADTQLRKQDLARMHDDSEEQGLARYHGHGEQSLVRAHRSGEQVLKRVCGCGGEQSLLPTHGSEEQHRTWTYSCREQGLAGWCSHGAQGQAPWGGRGNRAGTGCLTKESRAWCVVLALDDVTPQRSPRTAAAAGLKPWREDGGKVTQPCGQGGPGNGQRCAGFGGWAGSSQPGCFLPWPFPGLVVWLGHPQAWPTPLEACPMVAALPACTVWIPRPGPGTTQYGSARAHPPPQSSGRPLHGTQPVGSSPAAEMAPAEEPAVAPPPSGGTSLKTMGAEAPRSRLWVLWASPGVGATLLTCSSAPRTPHPALSSAPSSRTARLSQQGLAQRRSTLADSLWVKPRLEEQRWWAVPVAHDWWAGVT